MNQTAVIKCSFSDIVYKMFPGMPFVKDGHLYTNDKPGFGIEFDEKLAAKYPGNTRVTEWTQTRLPDGTLVNP